MPSSQPRRRVHRTPRDLLSRREATRGWRKRALIGALVLVCVLSLVAGDRSHTSGLAEADELPRAVMVATPVPAHEESDPLDGDPLDGPLAVTHQTDEKLVEFAIARSGRPSDAPNSAVAYDGDPQTVWSVAGDSVEPWVWIDLGQPERVREVRWLARGSGTIAVEVSSDRKTWRAAGEEPVRAGWQHVGVTGEARYVRLALSADDDGDLPAIAEISAYGIERGGSAALAQDTGKDKKKRERKTDDEPRARDRPHGNDASSNEVDKGTRAERLPGVTAEPGETDCQGKRAKCRAEAGEISVEKDACDGSGSCTIDIVANGGTATCDASGGDENTAGRGKGKSNDNGGRCEATANGGTVTIGDIDP
ncbi:MAG: discoidin domain-containing protein [Thermomicrobiales bacterium]